MRILICIAHDLATPRGNSIAALRLSAGFQEKGHKAAILENCETREAYEVVAHVRRVNPDLVVIMHAWRCATAFHAARSAVDAPVIVSLRGTDSNEMMEDIQKKGVIHSVLRASDAITVFSEDMRHKVVSHSPSVGSRIAIIPNGLHLPTSDLDYRKKLGLDSTAFVIVGVAGIRTEKRVVWLLNALSRVRARGVDLTYIHAGPVIDEAAGEMFRDYCKRKTWIHYAGVVPHSDVISFMKAGDLFISASRSEGMPHAVREAMAAELPCLLSDIEGHHGLARDGVEALFFDGEESFSSKLITLMNEKRLRRELAENGRLRVQRDLSRKPEIEEYLTLFAEVAKRRTTARPTFSKG